MKSLLVFPLLPFLVFPLLACGPSEYHPLPLGAIPQGVEPCFLYGSADFDNWITVLEVDGRPRQLGGHSEDWVAEFTPGTHSLLFEGGAEKPRGGHAESEALSLTMECRPGRIYQFVPTPYVYFQFNARAPDLRDWSPRLRDTTDEEFAREKILPFIRENRGGGEGRSR
jgi:hypothetical protein